MDNIKTPTKHMKYICDKCNFKCNKLSEYNRHIMTRKHNISKNDNEKTPKNATLKYLCKCGKEYKYNSGLIRHKKLCDNKNNSSIIITNNKDEIKDLVFKLINENKDLKNTLLKENLQLRNQIKEQNNQISQLLPKISNSNNTINSYTKNKFNINVFLNEKCKDALSMDEFVEKIDVSMKNLLTTKNNGLVNGITNIIMENMNKLSLYERPLHCTDKKRETLYVKNNEWEKDEKKHHITKALKSIESKQLKKLNVWLEEHPNYMNNPIEQEEFAKLMSECGKSVENGREKIIKNLCDNVYIDK